MPWLVVVVGLLHEACVAVCVRLAEPQMSLTPMPSEGRSHVALTVIERAEDGYAARCLRCGMAGPTQEMLGDA